MRRAYLFQQPGGFKLITVEWYGWRVIGVYGSEGEGRDRARDQGCYVEAVCYALH